jgi:leader peptidase (prepilin peptidase)/N-methyltransferase
VSTVIPAWQIHTFFILGLFAIGTVVGSFLNVCIYRIPWQKSVIWPSSRCPRCLSGISAQDNIPIMSWLALRGECRHCGLPISARYPMIEALVGLLFASVYVAIVVCGPPIGLGPLPSRVTVGLFYHLVFVALLVTATFIDYDLFVIPDQVTVPGTIVGIALGTLFPQIRPVPSTAATPWEGFLVGLIGLVAGAGLTQVVRLVGSAALRREAMGFGDVTLMAMIGSFLGWQAAVLTFFLAPFFGLGHALAKLISYLGKRLSGHKASSADREIPFGPYLSMAALALLVFWPWVWTHWAAGTFKSIRMLFSPVGP